MTDTTTTMSGERVNSLDAALTALLLHEWRVYHSEQGHYTVSITDKHGSEVFGKGESQLADAIWSSIRNLREAGRS